MLLAASRRSPASASRPPIRFGASWSSNRYGLSRHFCKVLMMAIAVTSLFAERRGSGDGRNPFGNERADPDDVGRKSQGVRDGAGTVTGVGSGGVVSVPEDEGRVAAS